MAAIMNGAATGAKWGRIGGFAGMGVGALIGVSFAIYKMR